MAVAHDNVSESAENSGALSYTWDHTPVGAPKGVLVFTFCPQQNNRVSNVTYGGEALAAVVGGTALDTAGEKGACTAWFLGTGIPAGVQAVVVTRTSVVGSQYGVCVTVTAASDTEATGVVLLQEDGALSEQNVDDGSPGTNSVRYVGAYSGIDSELDVGANTTYLIGETLVIDTCVASVARETVAGQGSRPVGFAEAASDDRAAVHLAILETAVAGGWGGLLEEKRNRLIYH